MTAGGDHAGTRAVVPLSYADRCERYARQRGWKYDPARLSIHRLTPRQRHRAIHKEWHQSPGYSRREIDMPWDPRYGLYNDGDDGAFCEPAYSAHGDGHGDECYCADCTGEPLGNLSYTNEMGY